MEKDRLSRRNVFGPVFAALAVPWLAVFFFSAAHPERNLKNDSAQYMQLADNLRLHAVFSSSPAAPFQPEIIRLPGYSLFLALVRSAFSSDLQAPIALQLLLGFCGLALMSGTLLSLSNGRAARIALLVWGLDIVYVLHMPWIVAESVLMFSLIVAFVAMERTIRAPSLFRSLGAGFLWGCAILIKPVVIFLPFPMSLVFWKNKKWLVAFLIGAYALPGLWCVRNYREAGAFKLSTQGGTDMLRYPASSVMAMVEGVTREEEEQKLIRSINDAHGGPWANAAERSDAFGKAAVQIMKQHPLLTLKFHLHGAVRILAGTGLEMVTDLVLPDDARLPADQTYKSSINGAGTVGFLKRYPLMFPVFCAYLLALLLTYVFYFKGLVALARERKFAEAFFLFCGPFYFVLVSCHQGYYRYRIPLMPFLIAGMSVGLSKILRTRSE